MSRRVFLGHKARQLRRDLGLTQLAMAERLGISPSYLNLIEHNRRPMTAGLLRKLAEEFDVESDSFSGRREVRLRDDLMEMLGDPLFRQRSARTADLDELVAAQPDFCRKVLTLYTAYRKDREALMAQSEKLANDPILADSSHRLLTLLTSVHSFGEILRDNADLPDSKRAEFAGILVDESERLTAQIRALFDFLGGGGLGPAQASELPREEVSEVLQANNNHYPDLEAAAAAARQDLGLDATVKNEGLLAGLQEALSRDTGVRVLLLEDPRAVRGLPAATGRERPAAMPQSSLAPGPVEAALQADAGQGWVGPRPWRFDPAGRRLLLAETLPLSSRCFQVARVFGQLRHEDLLRDLVSAANLSSDTARHLYGRALASYFAAALMMPYEDFRATAAALRHDIDRLAVRFGASFEQVCHRLSSLQRPGAEGVPFHFLRTDIAGNVDKRFSASGLALPRYGGVCPRWNIHAAFAGNGRMSVQLAELPDDSRYLFLAKSCRKTGFEPGYGEPDEGYSISLGCDISFANRIVYADAFDLSGRARGRPVGLNCRQCPREDCRQRAHSSQRN